MPSKVTNYRADIDGLRAVAIIAVVLFHLRIPSFSGGFVGVDIFFVISGFLITRLLVEEFRNTGKIRFSSFYARRIRRIAPALLATLLATLIAAYWVLGVDEMQAFGWSLVAATLSISNLYFWNVSGYFDIAAAAKPLLHTWSLSVEEQFYLVWPALILLALKWRAGRILLVSAIVGSLVANIALAYGLFPWAAKGPETAFYWMPLRAFEFGIGAFLVFIPNLPKAAEPISDFIAAIGGALIAAAVMRFSDAMTFPGAVVLVPCAGAAAVIYGGRGKLGQYLLANWPMAAIGRGSYSLYLVHWPITVFFELQYLRPPQGAEIMWLIGAMVTATGALHFLIERPFRYGGLRVIGGASVVAAAICVGGLTAGQNGFAFRVPPQMRSLVERTFAESATAKSGFLAPGCFVSGDTKTFAKDFDFDACITPDPTRPNVLIIGDSSAAYSFGALHELAEANGVNLMQSTATGCQPLVMPATDGCLARNEWFFDNLDALNARVVLMASWRPYAPDYLAGTIEALNKHGVEFTIIGPSLSFSRSLPSLVTGPADMPETVARARRAIQSDVFDTEKAFKQIAKDHGANYFSIVDHLCPSSAADSCDLTPGGVLVSFDTLHMPISAALAIFSGAPFLDR